MAYIMTMEHGVPPAPRGFQGLRNKMSDIKARITALAEVASARGLPAATEKQADYIVALMGRRNLSIKLLEGQTMLTKRGASNLIESIPLMNKGLV